MMMFPYNTKGPHFISKVPHICNFLRFSRFQDFFYCVSDPIGAKETVNIYNNQMIIETYYNEILLVKLGWLHLYRRLGAILLYSTKFSKFTFFTFLVQLFSAHNISKDEISTTNNGRVHFSYLYFMLMLFSCKYSIQVFSTE